MKLRLENNRTRNRKGRSTKRRVWDRLSLFMDKKLETTEVWTTCCNRQKLRQCVFWRGGRVADCTGLENLSELFEISWQRLLHQPASADVLPFEIAPSPIATALIPRSHSLPRKSAFRRFSRTQSHPPETGDSRRHIRRHIRLYFVPTRDYIIRIFRCHRRPGLSLRIGVL